MVSGLAMAIAVGVPVAVAVTVLVVMTYRHVFVNAINLLLFFIYPFLKIFV